jgi:hypothetical protein
VVKTLNCGKGCRIVEITKKFIEEIADVHPQERVPKGPKCNSVPYRKTHDEVISDEVENAIKLLIHKK